MSFFGDLFGGADQAANDQVNAINQGLREATGYINQGNQALTSNYTAGLQPFLQNYAASQPGVRQLGNVLGLNGAQGKNTALSTLQTTPGYQFALRSGDNAINAGAAANGTLGSGAQQMALSNYNQNTAQNTYQNYVNSLQPYLGYSTSGASGIGGLYSGLGGGLNQNYNNLANLDMNARASIGNAQASSALADQSMGLGLLGGGLNLIGSLFSPMS